VWQKDARVKFLVIIGICINVLFANGLEKNIMPYMKFNMDAAVSLLPKEYNVLKKAAHNSKKKSSEKYTILYFFSNSVPTSSFGDLLIEIAKYNRSHKKSIGATQALIGMNPALQTYLLNVKKYLKGLNDSKEEESLIDIRMAPNTFTKYHINVVPALALARCNSNAHPSKCEIVSLVKGDVSLSYFFRLLKENNLLLGEL
jgi:hypothetical protein